MAHPCATPTAVPKCDSSKSCPCSCGPCNAAARKQLIEEIDVWKRKIEELLRALDAAQYAKYLK